MWWMYTISVIQTQETTKGENFYVLLNQISLFGPISNAWMWWMQVRQSSFICYPIIKRAILSWLRLFLSPMEKLLSIWCENSLPFNFWRPFHLTWWRKNENSHFCSWSSSSSRWCFRGFILTLLQGHIWFNIFSQKVCLNHYIHTKSSLCCSTVL